MLIARSSSRNMTESKAPEEVLPLSNHSLPVPSRHPFFTWSSAQIRETLFCLVFAVVGYYGPKKGLFPSQESIMNRPIPMTVLQSGEVLLDSRYNNPLVNNPTIGSSMLIFTGVWVPIILILLVEFCRRQQNPKVILCSLLTTIGVTEGLTNMGKFYVRRHRPNYYALCGFNMATKTCTYPFQHIVEAQLSFPSGHTSLSFCSATVIALWLYRMNSTGSSSKVRQLLSCLVPLTWAAFVGTSRIVDYWHHPSDVLAGCILGTSCAILCFTVHHSSSSSTTSENKLASFHE